MALAQSVNASREFKERKNVFCLTVFPAFSSFIKIELFLPTSLWSVLSAHKLRKHFFSHINSAEIIEIIHFFYFLFAIN